MERPALELGDFADNPYYQRNPNMFSRLVSIFNGHAKI